MRAKIVAISFVGFSLLQGKAFYAPIFSVAAVVLVFYALWHILWRLRIRSATYVYTSKGDVSVPEGTKQRKMNVCVIGMGPSGVVATKELLEEGHSVTCYEKDSTIGGVFFYDKNKGGAYDSTILTISNYLMAFSDYPPPKGEDYRFWHHSEYFQYLMRYMDHFQLRQRADMQFSTSVKSVEREGAAWRVTTSRNGRTEERVFDAVAVCNGAHQEPNTPPIPGQENSPITICHSTSYKNASTDPRIAGKRVVCMGIGETGADISAEVAEAASKAWLSMRRPPHIVSRNHWNLGLPGDAFSTRAMFYCNKFYINFLHHQDAAAKVITSGWLGKLIFRGYLGLGDDVGAKISELGSRSGGGVAHQFLTKNDKFVPYLLKGTLAEKPNVSKIVGKTVHFSDGTRADDVDTIIMCTGFVNSFPFLPNDVNVSNMRELYKHAFHPRAGDTLAFIGFARPSTGGVPACSEAVARYWSLILSNKRKLPEDWVQRIPVEKATEEGMFTLSARITTLVFWGEYMESLASHIGCSPVLLKYAITRPSLWVSLFYGPLIPAQFRLGGPHQQAKMAEDVISNIPVQTPTPFCVGQTICCVLSMMGGVLFGYRPPTW